MRNAPERSTLHVVPHEGGWRVEHDGHAFGHSPEKNVAKAAASRHARELFDAGRACQVKVWGELGFWGR